MGRPRKPLTRKSVEIRLQIAVEPGSIEESLIKYLNNEEVRPFSKSQMLMAALKQYWQSAALLQEGQPLERVLQALEDSKLLWNLQEQSLRERIHRKYSTQAQTINIQSARSLTPLTEPPPLDKPLNVSYSPIQAQAIEVNEQVQSPETEQDSAATNSFNPFGDSVICRN